MNLHLFRGIRKLSGSLVLTCFAIVSSFAQMPGSAFQGKTVQAYNKSSYRSAPRNAGGADILLIQTSDPWNSTANIDVLDSLNKTYEVATWQEIENNTVDVFGYQVVLIVNDQVQQFYDDYASKKALFEEYVEKGGTLIFFAAGGGWANGVLNAKLPGNVSWFWQGGNAGTGGTDIDLFLRNKISNLIYSSTHKLPSFSSKKNGC